MNTETHLLTSPSLQADFIYKLILLWVYNLLINKFKENVYSNSSGVKMLRGGDV